MLSLNIHVDGCKDLNTENVYSLGPDWSSGQQNASLFYYLQQLFISKQDNSMNNYDELS